MLVIAMTQAAPTTTPSAIQTTIKPDSVRSVMPQNMKPQPKTGSIMSINPYRYNHGSRKQLNSINSVKKTSKSIESNKPIQASSSTNSNEKNWLLTKAWLIDNINRLRRELSELERDYSQHLTKTEQVNEQKEKQFIDDLTKLRADHTVLSQQQKQIIYLIKKSQIGRIGQTKASSSSSTMNDITYSSIDKQKLASNAIKKQINKRDLTQQTESFESETRRNMKEVFAEMSSLHDITLTLFDDIKSLEHRLESPIRM
ncbi:hypothetical protein RDWZM_005698 [Blomia tropicalis]|uniref:Uncharacterized protein n=1 Tax=Blomia tropicalis TaxID=40697 RepID=A0A9Q0M5Q8_BLOTA|nr:hypothetical protein RDWZM_005698 [Blomia tropicalis]